MTTEHAIFIDEELTSNDERISSILKSLLIEQWPELHDVSLSTIKRVRKQLGWVSTTPRYCQLIREANKKKRYDWCLKCLQDDEYFEDITFSDESTVALEK